MTFLLIVVAFIAMFVVIYYLHYNLSRKNQEVAYKLDSLQLADKKSVVRQKEMKTPLYRKCNDIICYFNFDNMVFFMNGKAEKFSDFYYFSNDDKPLVEKYFKECLRVLEQGDKISAQIFNEFSAPSTLSFTQKEEYIHDFTFFLYHPLTETGRIAKYPYSIHFVLDNTLNKSGEIFFKKDGSIGKIKAILWRNKTCYKLQCFLENEEIEFNTKKICCGEIGSN